jgi:hypothetical protein
MATAAAIVRIIDGTGLTSSATDPNKRPDAVPPVRRPRQNHRSECRQTDDSRSAEFRLQVEPETEYPAAAPATSHTAGPPVDVLATAIATDEIAGISGFKATDLITDWLPSKSRSCR